MPAPRQRFRATLNAALTRRPLRTPLGEVKRETRETTFGFPGGSHQPTRYWVYQPSGGAVEMLFGFQQNFTPDDLFSKVIPFGESLHEGAGASVQFNGDLCTAEEGGEVVLTHRGRITVTSAIKRADLVDAIHRTAPDAERALGGLDAKSGWPLRLGSTDDISALLDRLFLYGYAVEQAKRSLRGEPLLPALPSSLVTQRGVVAAWCPTAR